MNSIRSLSEACFKSRGTLSPWICLIFMNTFDRATESSWLPTKIETSCNTDTRALAPIIVFSFLPSRLSTITPERLGFRIRYRPLLPDTFAISFSISITGFNLFYTQSLTDSLPVSRKEPQSNAKISGEATRRFLNLQTRCCRIVLFRVPHRAPGLFRPRSQRIRVALPRFPAVVAGSLQFVPAAGDS